jgi:GNAT superfamily N-acetyltransferase
MASTSPDSLVVKSVDPRSPEAALLIARLSAELARRYDYTEDGSGNFRPEDVLVPRSIFVIGWLAGRPVACGAIRPMEQAVGELKRMYVEPDVRGMGLSKQILRALEEAARDMGYTALRLETGIRQPEAIGLYQAAGYYSIERYGIYVHEEQSVCFEKKLS